MKRHYIIASLLMAVFFSGCSEEAPENSGESPESIEVSFVYGGQQVKSLPFNSSSRSVRVDVTLNNQNVYWNVESDAEWCKVVEEKHRGDGSFTLSLLANDDWSDREPANITFVSGQYRGAGIQVTQTGNVFIVDKLFAVVGTGSGTEELEVSVKDGVEWDIVGDGWVSARKEASPVSEGGETRTRVTVSWDGNQESSRYGSVGFRRAGLEDADAEFSVFQFGNEVTFDEEGAIRMPARDCPAVKVKVPLTGVSGVTLPDWITFSTETGDDNTLTYSLMLSDNPSDMRAARESVVSFSVADKDVAVSMPAVKQDYYSVNGIMSAGGLKMFAETVNGGGDVSEWQSEGKTILLNNIDMSALDGPWASIGTAEHPFGGAFDGRYRKIMNLKSSVPLFGVCEGASVSNIIIDESSSFAAESEYVSECVLAPFVGVMNGGTLSGCTNNASVTMRAPTFGSSTSAYVAGLVARTDENAVISDSHNCGNVGITDAAKTAKGQGSLYAGGLVASNRGVIDGCTNGGAVSDAAVSYYHYLSGLVAVNGGEIKSSTNSGSVSVSALRVVDNQNDASRYICMGGIAGRNMAAGKISGSANDAALSSTSDVKIQRIGGVGGYMEGMDVSGNRNTANGKCDIKGASTTQRGVRQLSLGGLYGEVACDASLDFSADGECSAGPLTVSDFEESAESGIIFAGGMIGRVSSSFDASLKKPEWNSTITFNMKGSKFSCYVLGVGGIVGGVGVYETGTVSGGHLTVDGASVGGYVDIQASSKYALANKYAGIGGVAGFVSTGGVTLRGCASGARITQSDYCAKSNGYAQHVGGIAGLVLGGKSEISDCSNTGDIDNEHYNNNPWNSVGLQSGSSAGIIGAYAYNNDYTASLEISGCENTAVVRSYRGMSGGIAGYLRNAKISGCTNTGSMANGTRSYVGGIVGVADNSSIDDCHALCNVGGSTAGSEVFSGGGIAGILWTGSSCAGSSWFGEITSLTSDSRETAGGIAGSSASGTSVSGCKFGGTVRGSAVTAANFSSFVAGDGNASVSSCQYWNGK